MHILALPIQHESIDDNTIITDCNPLCFNKLVSYRLQEEVHGADFTYKALRIKRLIIGDYRKKDCITGKQ